MTWRCQKCGCGMVYPAVLCDGCEFDNNPVGCGIAILIAIVLPIYILWLSL